jgi:hypothetical protein
MKKNNMLFWGMLAMLLTVVFIVTGCPGTTDDGPAVEEYTGYAAGNVQYKLIITTPKDGGAAYVLNITPGGQRSSGTVTGKSNGVYTLKPSTGEAFTVTTSGAGITAMSGVITFTDGTTETAPTTLTPPSGNETPGNTDPKTLIITGIPAEYNGKEFTIIVNGMGGVAYNQGTNSDAAQTFALKKDEAGNNWTGSGECYLAIWIMNNSNGGEAKLLFYTNGANFTAQSETIPTYTISQAVSTVAFDKFFDVTSILDDTTGNTGGSTAKRITITGIPASYNNNNIDIMIMRVVDIPISQVLYKGSATISNGSATAALTTWDDQPFTGNGKYRIILRIGENSEYMFIYFNGVTSGSMSDIPLYTINENQAIPTIEFSKFFDVTAYQQ